MRRANEGPAYLGGTKSTPGRVNPISLLGMPHLPGGHISSGFHWVASRWTVVRRPHPVSSWAVPKRAPDALGPKVLYAALLLAHTLLMALGYQPFQVRLDLLAAV